MTQLLCLILICLQLNLIFSAMLEFDMKIIALNVSQSNNNTNSLENKLILSYLANPKQELLTLNTCIGPSDQCFNLVFATASSHVLVPSSNSQGCFSCRYFDQPYRSYDNYRDPHNWRYYITKPFRFIAIDNIKIGEALKDINMTFTIDDKIENGVIGFGRDFKEEAINQYNTPRNTSFMDMLKENGVIVRKVFSQKFTDYDKTEAKLFIGDLHEDFVNNTNVSSCRVVTKDPWLAKNKVADKWNCRLSHVILGDNKANNFDRNAIPINSIAVFDSTANFIMAPQSEIGPFKNYFEERNCTEERNSALQVTAFLCKDPYYNDLVEISLVLNGTSFLIPSKQLFQPAFNATKNDVAKILFVDNLDHWVLGQNFMKNIHIMFDSENNLVAFKPLNGSYVSDVSSMTTDDDFLLSDYYEYILLFMLVFVVAMFAAFILFLLRLRKTRVEDKSSIIGNANYALMEAQKI